MDQVKELKSHISESIAELTEIVAKYHKVKDKIATLQDDYKALQEKAIDEKTLEEFTQQNNLIDFIQAHKKAADELNSHYSSREGSFRNNLTRSHKNKIVQVINNSDNVRPALEDFARAIKDVHNVEVLDEYKEEMTAYYKAFEKEKANIMKPIECFYKNKALSDHSALFASGIQPWDAGKVRIYL